MDRRWIILIGWVPILILSLLGAEEAGPALSRRLGEEATRRLGAGGQDWARVEIVGRDGVLTGTAPERDLRPRALSLVAGIDGIRHVVDRTETVAEQRPYRWGLETSAAGTTLSGFVPSEAARRVLREAATAALPGRPVVDAMQLGGGAPPGFAEKVSGIIAQFAPLKSARVLSTDMNISVEAVADDDEKSGTLHVALEGAGFAISRLALTLPRVSPYRFEVTRSGEGLTLGGHVPSSALRRALLASATSVAGSGRVVDRLALASGEPEGFAAAAAILVAEAGRLTSARASMEGRVLALEGTAPDAGIYRAVLGAWRSGLPPGYSAGSLSVTAPVVSPYTLSLTVNGAALRLDGHLPDEAARASLVAAVRAARPDLAVDDQARLGLGAPARFAEAATFAASQLARLEDGRVALSDTAMTLAGKGRAGIDSAAIAAAAGGLPAGYTLSAENVVAGLPLARPFTLTLTRRASGMTVEGFVLSEEERGAVLSAVRVAVPETPVEAGIRIAAGRSEGLDWVALSRFAAMQLARLAAGTIRIEDGSLAVEAEAADRAGYVAVNRALRGPLPGGGRLASISIAAPRVSPFEWFVEKAEGGVVLQGYVPSDAVRAALVAEAKAAFAPLAVSDRQEIAAGAPDGFTDVAGMAITLAARMDRGRAILRDRSIAVTGLVGSAGAVEEMRAAAAAKVRQGWTQEVSVRAPAPPASVPVAAPPPAPAAPPPLDEAIACQAKIAEVIGQGAITFQLSRDELRPESLALIRRIAAVLQQCPRIAFTVEGHTDADGPAAQNMDLSHRRAQAVITQLMFQGVSASRLQAAGFGATRPVAPNDSVANKARNRRITFVARP